MKIEEHIKNLEEYCEDDIDFRSQTAEEEKSDFDIFCDNHIADIKEVIKELRTTQSDLYEANKRIADLLLILGDRDRMIDAMIEEYEYNARINLKNFCEDETRKDKCIQDCRICVKKYFEERCRDAKD